MNAEAQEADDIWQPQDAVAKATAASLLGGGAGFLIAAVQNTTARQNIGALGVFTRFGGTTALFASCGAAFAFTTAASANLREKGEHDIFSRALGGFVGGAIAGLYRRTFAAVLGNGMGLAVVMATVAYTHDRFTMSQEEKEEKRIAYKEEVRKRFRRPINELVNEIGEGRGIYPPGYEERRKQRIRENYGIEIQEPYYNRQPTED